MGLFLCNCQTLGLQFQLLLPELLYNYLINTKMNQPTASVFKLQTIRQVQIFYYSSLSQIFINTCIIQLSAYDNFPSNIKPIHHEFGELPIILVNNSHPVLRDKIWELFLSIFNIQLNKKYQFLSVVKLCEQLATATTLCSQIDLNPYFVFISPWKKYKMHLYIENVKAQFYQNTQYLSKHDSSLNKEYFLYKLNTLSKLMNIYETSSSQLLYKCYQIFVFAFLKHLKMIDEILLKAAMENKIFKAIYQKMTAQMIVKIQIQKPLRNVAFTNIQLPYLQAKPQKKQDHDQKYDPNRPSQRLIQTFFKPIFVSTIFTLGYLALK